MAPQAGVVGAASLEAKAAEVVAPAEVVVVMMVEVAVRTPVLR